MAVRTNQFSALQVPLLLLMRVAGLPSLLLV